MLGKILKKSVKFVKCRKKLKCNFPLNHLFIIFRLFGLAAYKRNKNGQFQICHISKLISFIMPIFLTYCSTLAMVTYFRQFVGFLNLPIAIAFIAWGGGCIVSYVTIVIKNANVCRSLNEMVEMKKIFEVKNPTYKLNDNYLIIVPFYLGFTIITISNMYDMLAYYDGINPFFRLTIFIIHDMYALMDTYFASVIISFWNLSKCFRSAFKIENHRFDQTITAYNRRQYDNNKRKNLRKTIDLLDFYKKNFHRLYDLRENLNEHFGMLNFVSSSYTLVALIYSVYSNTKTYQMDPFNSVKDFLYLVILYGGKLIAVLNICVKIHEEDYKLSRQLHLAFLDHKDAEIQEEVQIYTLQLLHHHFQFNAKGFFHMNFTLAMTITSVVATYAIILIQLQIGEDVCKQQSTS